MSKNILARTCGDGCPCRFKEHYTHLNVADRITGDEVQDINIRGRAEHETVILDTKYCEDIGLNVHYEREQYLKRWGSYLVNE